ncbi:glycosyltransferase family 4 protein [Actinomycetes bacterium M1A6_2h]
MAQLVAGWMVAGARLRRLTKAAGTTLVVNSLFALPSARIASPRGGASWLVHDIVNESKQRILVRASKSVASRTVAVSEASAASLRALGLDVTVVHLGVRRVAPRPFRPISGTPVVGMMGTLTEWKGARILLDAAAHLPEIEVRIAGRPFSGDETYCADLRERASRPDLQGRVHFLGQVDPMPVMAEWDALILPTLRPEPGPTVALEAMSIGVPIVGSDHGGIAEALRDGVGLLVEPGDPSALAAGIRTLLSDESARKKMSDAGKARTDSDYDIAHTLPSMLTKLVPQ